MIMNFSRTARSVSAVAGVLALLAASAAEARPGGGGSLGSRGSRTFDAPAATRTAPAPAAPIQRSQTSPSQVQPRPTAPVPQTAGQPRRFGFGTGLFAGLLGAGLLGALMGHGFFGGLAGIASFLGLLLQIGLIVGLVWLAVRFFRRRSEPQPAMAGAGAYGRSALGGVGPTPMGGSPAGGPTAGSTPGGGLDLAAAPRMRGRSDEVGIGPQDYAAFERALVETQTAYGREDVAALWNLATPEMAGYFQEELNENRQRNVVNRLSEVRLLQGDLAEAWRERASEYATVAMRYALKDATVDRTSGRVVAGDRDIPVEVTELWTFRRDNGGPWKLSAVQQTA